MIDWSNIKNLKINNEEVFKVKINGLVVWEKNNNPNPQPDENSNIEF